MRLRSRFHRAVLIAVLGLSSNHVMAVPDEVEVYTDEMSKPGQYGLELHLNRSIKGTQTPGYPGQTPSHHVTQVTPELFYGIMQNLEAGLYVPVAFAPDGNTYLNGLRLRLKFIAPREQSDPVFWGLNGEIGHASIRTSASTGIAELRPIVGYRGKDWLASFNPILGMSLDTHVSHQPRFEPALKLTHRVTDDVHAGAEYYGEYGNLTRFVPASQRSHTLYAVIDVESEGYDVNFGIGRGYVNASDRWVMKAIVALPFN